MAPMIDMVFLLLVFFMCVSTLAQAEKKSVELPQSAESQVPENLQDRGILTLDAEGTLYMGAREVETEAMQGMIKQTLHTHPQLKVQLRADAKTPYKAIKEVLRACAEVGVYDIVYATEQH